MIFTPEHIQMIIEGRKTQTRRVVKPGEWLGVAPRKALTLKGHIKWQVGSTYAVQPGRTKPGVWWHPHMPATARPEWDEKPTTGYIRGTWRELRICITEIRQELLQDISLEDIKAEGIYGWTFATGIVADNPPDPRWNYIEIWSAINTRSGTRWQDNPLVWVLTFAVDAGESA